MKKKKIIIISICIITFLSCFTLVLFIYDLYFSPFNTYDKKELKNFYEYSVTGNNNVRISSISIYADKPSLFYHLGDYKSADGFTDDELLEMKYCLNYSLEYLNSDNNSVEKYKSFEIAFHTGNGSGKKSIRFYITKQGEEYILESISTDWVCSLAQLNIFDEIQSLKYNGSINLVDDYTKLRIMKKLQELEISIQLDVDGRSKFEKMIKSILPSSNISWMINERTIYSNELWK